MLNFNFQAIILLSSLIFLFCIIFIIKKERLLLNYSLTWLFLGIFTLMISFFPEIIIKINNLLSASIVYNILSLTMLLFLVITLLIFSIIISKIKKQIVNLTQQLALLENEFKSLTIRKNIKNISIHNKKHDDSKKQILLKHYFNYLNMKKTFDMFEKYKYHEEFINNKFILITICYLIKQMENNELTKDTHFEYKKVDKL